MLGKTQANLLDSPVSYETVDLNFLVFVHAHLCWKFSVVMTHDQTGRYFHTRVCCVCIIPQGTVGSGLNECMNE